MSKSKQPTTHTGYRDSGTGQFITENKAKRNPDGTEKQKIPNPGHGNTKKK